MPRNKKTKYSIDEDYEDYEDEDSQVVSMDEDEDSESESEKRPKKPPRAVDKVSEAKPLRAIPLNAESKNAQPKDVLTPLFSLFLRAKGDSARWLGEETGTETLVSITGLRVREDGTLVELALRWSQGEEKQYGWIPFSTAIFGSVDDFLVHRDPRYKPELPVGEWITKGPDNTLRQAPGVNFGAELNNFIGLKNKNKKDSEREANPTRFPARLLDFSKINKVTEDPFPVNVKSVRANMAGMQFVRKGDNAYPLTNMRMRAPVGAVDPIKKSQLCTITGISIDPDGVLKEIGIQVNIEGETCFFTLPFVTTNTIAAVANLKDRGAGESKQFNFSAYIRVEDHRLVADAEFVAALTKRARDFPRNPVSFSPHLFAWNKIKQEEKNVYLQDVEENPRYTRAQKNGPKPVKARPSRLVGVDKKVEESTWLEWVFPTRAKVKVGTSRPAISGFVVSENEEGSFNLIKLIYVKNRETQYIPFVSPSDCPRRLNKNTQDHFARWDFVNESADKQFYTVESEAYLKEHLKKSRASEIFLIPSFMLLPISSMAAITNTAVTTTTSSVTVGETIQVRDLPNRLGIEVSREVKRNHHLTSLGVAGFEINSVTRVLNGIILTYEKKDFMFVPVNHRVLLPAFYNGIIEKKEGLLALTENVLTKLNELSVEARESNKMVWFPNGLFDWNELKIISEDVISKREKKRVREEEQAESLSEKEEDMELDKSEDESSHEEPPHKRRKEGEGVASNRYSMFRVMSYDEIKKASLHRRIIDTLFSEPFSEELDPNIIKSLLGEESSMKLLSQEHESISFELRCEMLEYYMQCCEQSSTENKFPESKTAAFFVGKRQRIMEMFPGKKPFEMLAMLGEYFKQIADVFKEDCQAMSQELLLARRSDEPVRHYPLK